MAKFDANGMTAKDLRTAVANGDVTPTQARDALIARYDAHTSTSRNMRWPSLLLLAEVLGFNASAGKATRADLCAHIEANRKAKARKPGADAPRVTSANAKPKASAKAKQPAKAQPKAQPKAEPQPQANALDQAARALASLDDKALAAFLTHVTSLRSGD